MMAIPALPFNIYVEIANKVCYTLFVIGDGTHNKKRYHTFTIRG